MSVEVALLGRFLRPLRRHFRGIRLSRDTAWSQYLAAAKRTDDAMRLSIPALDERNR